MGITFTRGQLCCLTHPLRSQAFKSILIVITGPPGLTRHLYHDALVEGLSRPERGQCSCQGHGPILPLFITIRLYNVSSFRYGDERRNLP